MIPMLANKVEGIWKMRFGIVIVFFCLTVATVNADLSVSFRLNPIHGFIEFLEGISGNTEKPQQFSDLFLKSRFADHLHMHLLQELMKIKANSRTYDSNHLTKAAMLSESLDDLKRRTRYLVSLVHRKKFHEILDVFFPVYKALVWDASEQKMLRWKEGLIRLMEHARLRKHLTAVRSFLGSTWSMGHGFRIFLYPIPGKNGGIKARSFGSDAESVGVLLDSDDITGSIGVVFHEMCHSLFGTRARDTKVHLEKAFRSLGGETWAQVFLRQNEVIATMFGNGLIFELANGRPDNASWYDDPFIDTLAKEEYPLFKRYIASGRQIDDAFCEECVRIYARRFSGSDGDFQNVFCSIHLISDDLIFKMSDLSKCLRATFELCGFTSTSSPIDHPNTINAAKHSRQSNILVVPESRLAEFRAFLEAFPEFMTYRSRLLEPDTEMVFASFDEKKKPFVAIRTNDMAHLKSFLLQIKNQRCLNPDAPFIFFGKREHLN